MLVIHQSPTYFLLLIIARLVPATRSLLLPVCHSSRCEAAWRARLSSWRPLRCVLHPKVPLEHIFQAQHPACACL
ncbi:uncharacterized protein BCR38DRAFT_442851 [Pseudomassariella vexata]|uniref:Secreted protein n=1 Tax=Pseudomassariella vexata TaxID=1141098 RepID=A0A1Y2DP13_9PEZI|nr:uncharacterized protein BCR38DRAFT_442851 [Pseudomassariella vexata]ORY60904.1 hypothetical protein BCR38DRAFT_442851 [Pseudomassariella vexata]